MYFHSPTTKCGWFLLWQQVQALAALWFCRLCGRARVLTLPSRESWQRSLWDGVVNHLPSFIFSAGHCSHLPWSLSRLPATLARVQVSAVKRQERKGIHLQGMYFKVNFHVEENISSHIRTRQSHNHNNMLWTGLKYLCLRQQCFTRPA